MMIEFKIQLDGNGGASIAQTPQITADQNAPAQQQVGPAYVASSAAAKTQKTGGDQPVNGLATGSPSPSSSSGSGTVFVIGPIVVCGSAPGHTGPGGDQPVNGLATGKPTALKDDAAQSEKAHNDKARVAKIPDRASEKMTKRVRARK